MKLLTKDLESKLVKANQLPEQEDPMILGKLFNPTGAGTWYLIDLNKEEGVFFALCEIHEPELGYVSVEELESFRGRFGLGIERDLHFTPCPLSQVRN